MKKEALTSTDEKMTKKIKGLEKKLTKNFDIGSGKPTKGKKGKKGAAASSHAVDDDLIIDEIDEDL